MPLWETARVFVKVILQAGQGNIITCGQRLINVFNFFVDSRRMGIKLLHYKLTGIVPWQRM